MIAGIGCDLSAIDRWNNEAMRNRIMLRWFDPRERDYVNGRGKMAGASAAGIFAAKEALAKALVERETMDGRDVEALIGVENKEGEEGADA